LAGVAALAAAPLPAPPFTPADASPAYSDEKVAIRDIRVWHLVIENGY
jgi:hypothetical protein